MADDVDLRAAAGTLFVIAGALHVAVGATALVSSVRPLPILLVLWGVLALGGVAATAAGLVPDRLAYVGGLCLLAVALIGYVDVYAFGASETVLGIEWQPPEGGHDHGSHDHGGSGRAGHHGTPDSGGFFAQLAGDHLGLPSKIVELAAAALLLVLLYRE